MKGIEELYSYVSGDDCDLPKAERLRLIANRILEDVGSDAEPAAPPMVLMEVPVKFEGHVNVLVPADVPKESRGEIATKLALARILATTRNPDCEEAERDALEELLEKFTEHEEWLGEIWDRCQTCGAGGSWQVTGEATKSCL